MINVGKYEAGSDILYVYVHKVQYRGKDKIAIRASLVHKLTDEVVETKSYKLKNQLIKHWKRLKND